MSNYIERQLEAQAEAVKNAWKRGNRDALNSLLREIEAHDYTTISEIKGAINTDLDRLERLK